MTTILLVDTNYTFTADVESRLILNEIPDLQIVALNNVDDVFRIVQNVQPDKVLLNAAVLEMYPDWNLTIPKSFLMQEIRIVSPWHQSIISRVMG